MQTPDTDSTGSQFRELHLRLAIRNGLILIILSFVMGVAAAWAATHWSTAPLGALLGATIGAGFVAWFVRMWVVTRGLLHHSGIRKTDAFGQP